MSIKVNDMVKVNYSEEFKKFVNEIIEQLGDDGLLICSKNLMKYDGQIGRIIGFVDDVLVKVLFGDNELHLISKEFLEKVDFNKKSIQLGNAVETANGDIYMVCGKDTILNLFNIKTCEIIPLTDYNTNMTYKKRTCKHLDIVTVYDNLMDKRVLFTTNKTNNILLSDDDIEGINEIVNNLKMSVKDIESITKLKDVPSSVDISKVNNALAVKVEMGTIIAYFDDGLFENLEFNKEYSKEELGL